MRGEKLQNNILFSFYDRSLIFGIEAAEVNQEKVINCYNKRMRKKICDVGNMFYRLATSVRQKEKSSPSQE